MQGSWDEQLPDCCYEHKQPSLIKPCSPTPNHLLYLSNLDDQKFLRFSIKYLYLFEKSVPINLLKQSLSRVLIDYYPLAGRLKNLQPRHEHDDNRLQVDCNGEGAVFAEAFMDMSAQEFLQVSKKPSKSWRKLLFKVDAPTFVDTPPLVVQSLMEGPESKDWLKICDSLNDVRKKVVMVLVKSMKNPRSA